MSKPNHLVYIGTRCADLTVLRGLSEQLYQDASRYGEILAAMPDKIQASTATSYLKKIELIMVRSFEQLPAEDVEQIRQRGLSALAAEGGRLLSIIYSDQANLVNQRTVLRLAVAALFPDVPLSKKALRAHRLAFVSEFSREPVYVDFSAVYGISPRLYQELASHLEILKETLAASSINLTTLQTRFTHFRSVLLFGLTQLGDAAAHKLKEFGMKAFSMDGGKLQKAIFAELQNAVKTQVLTSGSANMYRYALAGFMKDFELPVVDAYPIPTGRSAVHLTRLNASDYYSAEECRELAFHVERLLETSNLTSEHRVSLLLGRILLKTGWNLAPTLGIECEDIIRETSPLNPGGTLTVVLSKARAGYRSDAYSFVDAGANRAAIRSAALDLLEIRDELTARVRETLAGDDPFRSYVFVYEHEGVVHRIGPAVTSTISDLLLANGCSLRFDTRKIRKGGYNHLYRTLQKNAQDYANAAKHEFKTFEASYLRVDENQARYTLSKAVDVMGNYFTGKEIAADIVIATDAVQVMQHTPTGECASTGDDAEAARYGVEHKRLHAERKQDARFCADFLSCIWCKYFRLVADPEHVWKLLSYRDYLLSTMEASVVEGDASVDQQIHIDILKGRIKDMLGIAEKLHAGVTAKGELLLREKGMHPDWSFALADAP